MEFVDDLADPNRDKQSAPASNAVDFLRWKM